MVTICRLNPGWGEREGGKKEQGREGREGRREGKICKWSHLASVPTTGPSGYWPHLGSWGVPFMNTIQGAALTSFLKRSLISLRKRLTVSCWQDTKVNCYDSLHRTSIPVRLFLPHWSCPLFQLLTARFVVLDSYSLVPLSCGSHSHKHYCKICALVTCLLLYIFFWGSFVLPYLL